MEIILGKWTKSLVSGLRDHHMLVVLGKKPRIASYNRLLHLNNSTYIQLSDVTGLIYDISINVH